MGVCCVATNWGREGGGRDCVPTAAPGRAVLVSDVLSFFAGVGAGVKRSEEVRLVACVDAERNDMLNVESAGAR